MVSHPTLPLPFAEWLTGRCQRQNIIGRHAPGARITGRIRQGLGIKSGIRRWLRSPSPSRTSRLGEPPHFAEGTWVRVRDAASIRQTLDERSRHRGLLFTPQQWATCGKVFRVRQAVRRLYDDQGRFRAVSRTVLLHGLDCGGEDGTEGCGRHCPMMYRDAWLEPADAPCLETSCRRAQNGHARIRSRAELLARLDLFGGSDGLMFMAEMARYAGTRVPVVGQLPPVFEYERWVSTPRPIYILEGLSCTGSVLGSDGPCDRACPLLWHADWLELDGRGVEPPGQVGRP
jgi:hypothetical protein